MQANKVMAKIFQLELFIKEMSIWQLPPITNDGDETCVEVTIFDIKKFPIKKEALSKTDTMNRGQNFLFTLESYPTDKTEMFFNVFKRTDDGVKKQVGTGLIPLDKYFSDIFLQTFATANSTDEMYSASAKQQPHVESPAIQNASTVHPIPTISKLTKDIYPIIGTDSNQWGMVCMLLRLTSFGNFSAHPIHIHQKHKEIIVQNVPNTALYERVRLGDSSKGKDPEHFISSFASNSGKTYLIYNRMPKVKDFSFQCSADDILSEMRQERS